MIQSLRTSTPGVKQVWPADDSAGGGQIESLYNWYNHLSQEGKKHGYLVNGSERADRVRKMRTEAWRESWREKKNDDLLASTCRLLNGTEMGSF